MITSAWRIVRNNGELVPVRVADGVGVSVGEARTELDRAPFSNTVVLLDGDGGLNPRTLDVDFLALGRNALDRVGAMEELRDLERALRNSPRAFWGAGPYEGFYVPLLAALPSADYSFEGPQGQYRLPYLLIPATVGRNFLAEGWRYPVIDDADETARASVRTITESRNAAPVRAFDENSRYGFPLDFPVMPQGTLFIGDTGEVEGDRNLLMLGAAGDPNGVVLEVVGGSYRARVGDAVLAVPAADVGSGGSLKFWALTFSRGRFLRLYSASRLGFKNHGAVPAPFYGDLRSAYVSVGPTRSGEPPSTLFLGAPQHGAPLLTHRVWEEDETREALLRQLGFWSRYSAFTPTVPVPGLELSQPAPAALTAGGATVRVPLEIVRKNGYGGPVEVLVQNDEPGLSVTVEVTGGGNGSDETEEPVYNLVLVAADGLVAEGDQRGYEVLVTARAPDALTNPANAQVTSTKTLAVTVRGSVPALGPAVRAEWRFQGSTSNPSAFLADSSGGGRTVTLRGNAHASPRLDAVYNTGFTDPVTGEVAAVYADNALADMAGAHSVTAHVVDLSEMPDGATVLLMTSQAATHSWWMAYKTSQGLKLRTSQGDRVRADSPAAVPIPVEAATPLAVVFDRAANAVSLFDPRNPNVRATLPAPAWVGAGPGRLCWFGHVLPDSRVPVSSRGVCGATVVNAAALTSAEARGQLEATSGYLRRGASTPDLPEWPAPLVYVYSSPEGAEAKNVHPRRAADLVRKGATPAFANGRTTTAGTADTVIRTPGFLAGTDGADDFDVVMVLKDLALGTSTQARFGVTLEANQNHYAYVGVSSGKVSLRLNAGSGVGFPVHADMPAAGVQAYVLRCRNSQNYVELLHPATGKTLRATVAAGGSMGWSGLYMLNQGGLYRGKNSSGVYRGEAVGIEETSASEALGFAPSLRPLTDAEIAELAALLGGSFDLAPVDNTPSVVVTPTSVTVQQGGAPVQFSAAVFNSSAQVVWSLSPATGAGTLSSTGLYTPPSSGVTQSRTVLVTATLGTSGVSDTSEVTLTPPGAAQTGLAKVAPSGAVVDGTVLDSSAYALTNLGTSDTDKRRVYATRLDTWYKQSDANRTGTPYLYLNKLPESYNVGDTLPANFDKVGAYKVARNLTRWAYTHQEAARTTRDPRLIDEAYRYQDRVLGLPDLRGGLGTTADDQWLGYRYGSEVGSKYVAGVTGTISILEDAVMLGGLGVHSWMLWQNRKVSSPAGHTEAQRVALVDKTRALWKYHFVPRYVAKYGSPTGGVPGYVRRRMVHCWRNEICFLMYVAMIESEMFAAGRTSAVTVDLPKGFRHSVSLEPGTSADPRTHPYWGVAKQMELYFWASDVQSPTTVFFAAKDRFKYEWAKTAYPDGAVVFSQDVRDTTRSIMSNVYTENSWPAFKNAWLEGLMDDALGASTADLRIRQIVATISTGVLAERYAPADFSTKGYATIMDGPTSRTECEAFTSRFVAGDGTGSVRGADEWCKTAYAALAFKDSHGRIGDVTRRWLESFGNKQNAPGANATMLFDEVWKKGRK